MSRDDIVKVGIPKEEFLERVRKIQVKMKDEQLDIIVTHACECESANVRYLSNFWAVFDFAGVVIPKTGEAVLLTGGPESYEFARTFSQIDDVRVHPLYVETSAPEWDKTTDNYNFKKLFNKLESRFEIKKIGIANENIIPYKIIKDIEKAAPNAVFTNADDILLESRWYKSENEIALLKKAYEITEEGVKRVIETLKPGMTEWQIESIWRGEVYKLGAEGTSYPVWVTSGPSTFQSLCRSTERVIEDNDMVQLTFGAKYKGYCGNMCRPVIIGKIPQRHEYMIKVAFEALEDTLDTIRPGVLFKDVYNKFRDRLDKNGFPNSNLYGPAHGTGLQECEGPWVDNRTDLVFKKNMAFNIDIWVADDKFGVRYEDGVIINETGIDILTNYRREIIKL